MNEIGTLEEKWQGVGGRRRLGKELALVHDQILQLLNDRQIIKGKQESTKHQNEEKYL